jgi:hypothetical protein
MAERTPPGLAAMTVNERLRFVGLMDQWDAAARAHDRDAMFKILKQVEIIDPAPIVDAVLTDPEKFGFQSSSRT